MPERQVFPFNIITMRIDSFEAFVASVFVFDCGCVNIMLRNLRKRRPYCESLYCFEKLHFCDDSWFAWKVIFFKNVLLSISLSTTLITQFYLRLFPLHFNKQINKSTKHIYFQKNVIEVWSNSGRHQVSRRRGKNVGSMASRRHVSRILEVSLLIY